MDDFAVRTAVVELLHNNPAEKGLLRARVNGNSMLPVLQPGDLLVIQPVPARAYRQGDIVLARRQHDLVTHRLVGRDKQGWRMKGDHCHRLDPYLPEEDFLGRVVEFERDGRVISLQSRRWQAFGWLWAEWHWWLAKIYMLLSPVVKP